MKNEQYSQSAQIPGNTLETLNHSGPCPDCAGTGYQPGKAALPLYFCATCHGTGLADPEAALAFINERGIVTEDELPRDLPLPTSPPPLGHTTHPYSEMCGLLRVLRRTVTELRSDVEADDDETLSHQDHLIRQLGELVDDIGATLQRSQITIDGMTRARRHLQALDNAHWVFENLQGEEDEQARDCALYAMYEAHDNLTVVAGEV